jgi:biotin carboxyl carrier protein
MKKLRVTVEGKSYEVLVEMLDDSQVAAPAVSAPVIAAPVVAAPVVSAPVVAPVVAPAPKAAPSGPGDVLSPLAGKVVSLEVKVGDKVTEGQQVATIEAMKMNTYIYAARAGTVTAIPVAPGDGVNEGAVLVSIA